MPRCDEGSHTHTRAPAAMRELRRVQKRACAAKSEERRAHPMEGLSSVPTRRDGLSARKPLNAAGPASVIVVVTPGASGEEACAAWGGVGGAGSNGGV
jgi:hypothetical protein